MYLDAYGMEIGFLSYSQQLDRPPIEIVRDRLRQFLFQKAAGDGVSCRALAERGETSDGPDS
ncbi:MAG: hypothetical protein VXZ55_00405, partial [Planctomycetota bacterium]|nr:hypothetical protein [Planctomycetota bacterium]